MRLARLTTLALLLAGCASAGAHGGSASTADRAGVAAFNRALDSATRTMDNAATLALWADDGVTLLPDTKPIVGKPAIAAFLTRVTGGITGARMTSFTMTCDGIAVSGPLASEWCVEHQVVALPDGKTFDGWGKMLLVLRRDPDGRWRLLREMWNQGSPTDSAAS